MFLGIYPNPCAYNAIANMIFTELVHNCICA